jgi:hypothetical protein
VIKVGSLVKFVWWSNYKAPSLSADDRGHVSWHELTPGDSGIVMSFLGEESVVVLFSKVSTLLKIHRSMLELV